MSKLLLCLSLLVSPALNATCGTASYYEHGARTASGKRFLPNGLSAAHKYLPFGTKLKVSYNGKSVPVVVNDRGPFIKGRILDLSRGAAKALGLHKRGVGRVCFERG